MNREELIAEALRIDALPGHQVTKFGLTPAGDYSLTYEVSGSGDPWTMVSPKDWTGHVEERRLVAEVWKEFETLRKPRSRARVREIGPG